MPSKTFRSIISDAEEAAASVILENIATLENARAAAAQAGPDRSAAAEHVTEIETSWRKGEETFSPAAHAAAKSAVVMAEQREVGAKRRLQTASARRLVADSRVARALVGAITRALPGADVIATHVNPDAKPRANELPVAVLTQDTPTDLKPGGGIAADVTLTFYRGEIHKGLTVQQVEGACAEAGLRVEATSFVRSHDDGDTLRLKVHSAFDSAPVLTRIAPNAPDVLGQQVAREVVKAVRYGSDIPTSLPFKHLHESGLVIAMPLGSRLVGEEIVADEHERTVTVEATLALKVKTEKPGMAAVRGEVEDVAHGLAHKMLPGLGILQSAEVVPTEGFKAEDAATEIRSALGLPHDVASIGYEVLDHAVVTVRATLTSVTDASAVAA